jgi:hypothetical protein
MFGDIELSKQDTTAADTGPMIDNRPGEDELLAEVHRLTYIAARVRPVQTWVSWVDGHPVVHRDRDEPALPAVGSQQWWEAPERLRIAALVVLASAYLVADPERRVAEGLKAASVAVSEEIKRERELVRRRRDTIGAALRRGDTRRAIALTEHHASNQWAEPALGEEAAPL